MPSERSKHRVTLRRVRGEEYEFRHPRCAQQRRADIEEVRQMLAHGELELAEDELRWLLQDCPAFIEAHQLLGWVAEQQGQLELARAHYGYAFELGLRPLRQVRRGRLDYRRPANRPWFAAAAGLYRSLLAQDDRRQAEEVLNTALHWDPEVRLAEL